MKYIDMHCDTLMKAFFRNAEDCYDSPGMCDVKKMKEGGCLAQFLGIFLTQPTSSFWQTRELVDDDTYLRTCVNIFNTTMERYPNLIAPARSAEDIIENEKKGLMSGLLTVEDGRDANSFERIKLYHDLGIRLITLTWNFANAWGSPNSSDPAVMNTGLTDFGKEGVRYMNELGMLVDVSHLSDGGFWDVVKFSEKPFVASHSNARAIAPHRRCMTDEMIRAVAEKGGCIGLNFMPEFLQPDTVSKHSDITLMARHARHIINVGGEDVLGIGTDFDGFSGDPLDISGSHEMQKLFDYFKANGFTDTEIEKIGWKNSLRVIKEVLG